MHADFLGLYMLGIFYKHDGSEKEREERGRGVFFHEKSTCPLPLQACSQGTIHMHRLKANNPCRLCLEN